MSFIPVLNGNNQDVEHSVTKSYGTVKASAYDFTSLIFSSKYSYQSIFILLCGSAGEIGCRWATVKVQIPSYRVT